MIIEKSTFKHLAQLCRISYLNNTTIKQCFINRSFKTDYQVLEKCKEIPELYSRERDSQMCICKYNNKLTIAFRGTNSYRDIFVNLYFIRKPMYLKNIEESKFPLVHNGFYNQFLELKPDIDKILETYTGKDIYITGHSLGGSLATIACLNYQMEYPDKNFYCVTFGSPRVGDYYFSKYFNEHIKYSYRFVNDNDPVPCLPSAWNYRHVKGCIWLFEDEIKNEIRVWRSWRFIKNYIKSFFGYGYNAIKDHSCKGYADDIDIILK